MSIISDFIDKSSHTHTQTYINRQTDRPILREQNKSIDRLRDRETNKRIDKIPMFP